MLRGPLLARVAVVTAVVSVAFSVQSALTAGPSSPSAVITLDPARILDTRLGLGVPGTQPSGAGETITLQVAGREGVPVNATGVIITVTATGATANSFVTATPTGTARSATSVLNVQPGVDIANTVTMALGTGGKIDLFHNAGNMHLVADVSGYLIPEAGGATPQIETTTVQYLGYDAVEATGTVGQNLGNGCVDLANDAEVILDLRLPSGAIPKSVVVNYHDTDVQEITFVLVEVNNIGGTPSTTGTLTNGQAESTIATGYGTATITPGGADPVSNSVRYYLDAFTLGQTLGNTAHWFCGASVTYDRLAS